MREALEGGLSLQAEVSHLFLLGFPNHLEVLQLISFAFQLIRQVSSDSLKQYLHQPLSPRFLEKLH